MMTTKKLPTHSNYLPWFGLSIIVILLDQLSKIVISEIFVYGQTMPITSFFNLTLVYNTGAAFSFLANQSGWQRHVLTAISLAAALYMIYLIIRHNSQRLFCFAVALILGGAVGNVIDRILYGHVIDFLDFYYGYSHFPAFNLADSAICLGAGLFILDELRRVRNK